MMTEDKKDKNLEVKDDLRNKFPSTFKLFDDEGPTVPVEVTNVGKPAFNINDFAPKKQNEKQSEKVLEKSLEIDIDIDVDEPIKISDKIIENKAFMMNSELNSKQKKEELINSNSQKHYKVLKFFKRLTVGIFDQLLILLGTYIYFMLFIKSNVIDIPFKEIEGITYFIINDKSNFKLLIIAYLAIAFLYYTVFNITLKSTLFGYIMGYKIYKNDEIASVFVLILRNITVIALNIVLLLFPYLFMMVSDDKQTVYDKIFKTYYLKES